MGTPTVVAVGVVVVEIVGIVLLCFMVVCGALIGGGRGSKGTKAPGDGRTCIDAAIERVPVDVDESSPGIGTAVGTLAFDENGVVAGTVAVVVPSTMVGVCSVCCCGC